MLIISDELRTAITTNKQNIVTFALVHIGFSANPAINLPAGGLNITDAPHDITVDGRTYVADRTFGETAATGNLRSVSPPRAEGEVDRDRFEIVVTDPLFIYARLLGAESTGLPVSIVLGFKDMDGNMIDETLPVYSGQISSWSSTVDSDDEPTVTIMCTGPLTKLRQVTNRLTTEASQKAVDSTDTAFDLSFDTENEASLRWGPGD